MLSPGRALAHSHSAVLSWIVFGGCLAFVITRTATAPSPPPPRVASPDERALFAASIGAREAQWRSDVVTRFPSDHWSQRDAFHGLEAKAIIARAREAGVSIEDVLRAVDEDVHLAHGSSREDRSADVVPCKPRPIFD